MYKKVLLTEKEVMLLQRVVKDHLYEKITPDHNNLTIILNRLRAVTPLKKNNQFFNYGK
jgi:hypothetical protein